MCVLQETGEEDGLLGQGILNEHDWLCGERSGQVQDRRRTQVLQIPRHVEAIIGELRKNGFEAYAVGGCVRDALLHRVPGDWDITTSAHPQEVKKLFRRTVDTGIRHGTVTVLMGRAGYEVTTYRVDGIYADGRHPESVTYTSDLLEDLKRRDFTINAMAYSHGTGIVDVFDGMGDLKRELVRCVGDPLERFTEDALRILRAIRFSAQLGFAIEQETRAAIAAIAPNIARISRERIQAELTKILLSGHPEKIKEVYEMGISPYVCPGFDKIPWHDIKIPADLPARKYVRWSAFLRLVPAMEAVNILRALRMDNETIAKVNTLVSWSARPLEETAPAVRRALSQMQPEVWEALMDLNQYSDRIRLLTREIRSRGDCLGLGDLAVKGRDLAAAGVKPGRGMGELLELMLEDVLENPGHNQKELLMEKFLSGKTCTCPGDMI